MIDGEHLKKLAYESKEMYMQAEPFPSIAIDDFLPLEMAEDILKNFPNPDDMMSAKKYQEFERRVAIDPEDEDFPEILEKYFYELNSHKIINFLEILTGIEGLVADPHFIGGGLIHTLSGGRLPLHVDFSVHKHLNLHRRLNLLIYLNKEWDETWGGGAELWSRDGKKCIKNIAPKFNRAVIFEIADTSWHGHPMPISCPEDVTRKSMNFYFYSTAKNPYQEKDIFWTKHLLPRDMQ